MPFEVLQGKKAAGKGFGCINLYLRNAPLFFSQNARKAYERCEKLREIQVGVVCLLRRVCHFFHFIEDPS